MGPSLEDERRRHRFARVVATASVVAVVVVVVVVWFVGLLGREVVRDGATRQAGAGAAANGLAVQQTGRPDPQLLAEAVVEEDQPGLRLQLPIRREAITGIGYSPRRERDVLELRPTGHRANLSWGRRTLERFLSTSPPGDLTWFRLDDGTPQMVTIGAAEGAEVYAPIDGTIIAISDYRLSGEAHGVLVQIQPLGDAQTVVVMRNIDAAADLEVGIKVSEGATRMGRVRDMEGAIDAPLSGYTHDSGSGAEMYVLRVASDGASL